VESRCIEEGKGNPGPIEVCWNPRAQLEIIWQKNLVPLAGELEQGRNTISFGKSRRTEAYDRIAGVNDRRSGVHARRTGLHCRRTVLLDRRTGLHDRKIIAYAWRTELH
jgi:hypothetical protein